MQEAVGGHLVYLDRIAGMTQLFCVGEGDFANDKATVWRRAEPRVREKQS